MTRLLAIVAAVVAIGLAGWVFFDARATHAAPDFSLVDQHGRPFVLSAQRGHAVVLFFGYTHCPDVCPTTLAHEERAIARLGAPGKNVEIVFVTVDPERDDPAALENYADAFGPNVFALRGDARALQHAYDGYHVYHQDLPRRAGVRGYAVAHSSAVYYIARDGALSAYGDWSDAPSDVAADLRKALA